MNKANYDEEALYDQLKRLGRKLHIPTPEAFWEIEVRDQNGEVVHCLKQRSHSWVRNAYNLIFTTLAGKDLDDGTFGPGKLNLKDTSNVVRYGEANTCCYIHQSSDAAGWGYRGLAGSHAFGILVGNGINPEDFESYYLHTVIANGTGVGQLSYVQGEPNSLTWIAGTLTLKNEIVRYFNNNSGADVDVTEVALVRHEYRPKSSVDTYYMMARDLLDSTVTVPDTGQLKVTYTIQLTYPA
jgi:hypothetical protein